MLFAVTVGRCKLDRSELSYMGMLGFSYFCRCPPPCSNDGYRCAKAAASPRLFRSWCATPRIWYRTTRPLGVLPLGAQCVTHVSCAGCVGERWMTTAGCARESWLHAITVSRHSKTMCGNPTRHAGVFVLRICYRVATLGIMPRTPGQGRCRAAHLTAIDALSQAPAPTSRPE